MGAMAAVSVSASIDSCTIYAQPCAFRALANIRGKCPAEEDVYCVLGAKRAAGVFVSAAGVFVRKLQPRRPGMLERLLGV